MSVFKAVILIGVVQGFFLTLGLIVRNWNRKKQNYYFLALLVLISLALLSKYFFSVAAYNANPHLWFLADSVAYLIGPLWYLTIQKSIRPKVKLEKVDWLLLTPMLYFVGLLIYISTLSRMELLQAEVEAWYPRSFYLFCFTVLIVNGGFLWQSRMLLKKNRGPQFPDLLIRGQYTMLSIVGIWMVFFVVSLGAGEGYNLNLAVYDYAFLSFAFLTFGMAFLALARPAAFYFLTQTFNTSETYVLRQIAEKVEIYIEHEQPFLRRNFTLNALSDAIGSNPVLTSKAINRMLQTTFPDLMNGYRVRHFLQLAKEERMQNLTHWAIAQEAGFGNKVSFYKAFKKLYGTTPKVYLDAQS